MPHIPYIPEDESRLGKEKECRAGFKIRRFTSGWDASKSPLCERTKNFVIEMKFIPPATLKETDVFRKQALGDGINGQLTPQFSSSSHIHENTA